MTDKFVIICDDRFNKNNILFLTDNKKNPKKNVGQSFLEMLLYLITIELLQE